MDEASAIARLQSIALTAAKALQPTGIPDLPPAAHVLLVCTRTSIPKGERFRLIPNMKSPLGKLATVKPTGFKAEWYKWIGRDNKVSGDMPPPQEMLNACIASLPPRKDTP